MPSNITSQFSSVLFIDGVEITKSFPNTLEIRERFNPVFRFVSEQSFCMVAPISSKLIAVFKKMDRKSEYFDDNVWQETRFE